MLRAVIFDFDGVITDSEILHFRTFNKILEPYGITISLKDYYKNYLGLSDFDLLNLFADKGLLNLDTDQRKDLVEQKNKLFKTLAKTEGKIIKGVRDFIAMLYKNNIHLAICSGALLSEIEMILQDSNLRSFFDVIISAELVTKGKPHPQGFALTLQKLNNKKTEQILPSQCIAVEDSQWGLEAAKAAGMHTIAVTNSYEPDQLNLAEKIVTQLNELTMKDLQTLCR